MPLINAARDIAFVALGADKAGVLDDLEKQLKDALAEFKGKVWQK